MFAQRGSGDDPDWHGSPLPGWVGQEELRRARAANDRGPRRRRRAGELSDGTPRTFALRKAD
eukprot:13261748-Alexandrium_andersonii.AAC.1